MWGLAQLYDQIHFQHAFSSPADLALTAGAYALLAFPTSLSLLALTGAASAFALFGAMPVSYHHQYFSGLTGVALGLGAAAAARGADVERVLFAPLRWMAVLLYLVSAVHKMNPEFFSPDTGCGQQFVSGALAAFGLFVGSSGVLAVLGGLMGVAAELSIPILLLRRQTRLVGVGLGALFHFAMAVLGYARFSALMLALLLLFIDVGRLERVVALPRNGLRPIRLGLIIGGLAFTAWKADPTGRLPEPPLWRLDLALTWFTIAACLAVAVLSGFLRGGAANAGVLRMAPAAALGPALVLISGLSPYFGLGTLHSFSMYSNVKTEGPHRNHAFLGSWLETFGYQRDLVEIRASNIPELQNFADRRWAIPWVGFLQILQRHAATAPRVTVAYARDSQVREVPDAARDPELSAPLSPFERKLLSFRPIEIEGPRLCTH
jgi:hypothetical protein